ncbi:hypothetical protein [Cloacibacillus porcorum]|jgi:hypothetical protein|uniref:Uncharacterized protein n=1 Tax=Cloacibacillus porcorum TaxID=1197717 RepID=A0A1B2I2Y7_9BACT|nr:hypothetical protein [Cloacibacillus porcorum]ANZ44338.1 hypothetical protein BED41_04080 [Cloacibacillus porcorum]MCI5865751.1 hypothetical protein [Cloacibacillus porcorum]
MCWWKDKSCVTFISIIVTAIVSLLSVIVGGYVKTNGELSIIRENYEREQKSLANAFAGEITIILSSMEAREYHKIFINILKNIENDVMPLSDLPLFSINLDVAFPMYRTRIGDVGLLPADASKKLVMFYGYVFSLLEDVQNSPKLFLASSKEIATDESEIKRNYYRMWKMTCEQDLKILNKLFTLGNCLINDLEKFAK